MRNVLLLCLMAVLATHTGMSADILSSGNTANIPEAGVPQELARWRKATYTDVWYRLHFDIPEERTERVDGQITVSLRLETPADIVLDFREPASSIHEIRINGTLPQPSCIIQNEHIVIPAALTRAGENTVDIVFTAGDQSLNRNDEFLYTLLVPDRARTLFPCFDQPDMKALYTLSLEVPATWKAVSNTYVDKEENLPAEEGKEARKLITFSRTEPLSTYLFSFVAGEFYRKDYDDGRHRFSAYYRETDTARLPVRRDGTHRSHSVQRRPYVPESQPHPRGQTIKDRTDSP